MISAMAFLLYNLASRHIAMGRISLYSVRQAPFGAVLAALLLGETISAVEFGGMTLGPPMIGKLLGHTQVQTIAR